MAKKNPYVTTIGFNKEDPDHVYVADFLNSMGRGKGQYIVKAIMAYQNPEGVATGHVVVPAVDYEKIRAFVLQILAERTSTSEIGESDTKLIKRLEEVRKKKVREEKIEGIELLDIDEVAMNDIIASLSVFR